MKVEIDQFVPVLEFSFRIEDGKQIVCQKWVTATGLAEFRPVQFVTLDESKSKTIAGYYEDEDS